MGSELPGQLRKQSLVIEDYYCVSVEPSNTQGAPESLLTDILDASPKEDNTCDSPPPGPDSSFLSDGEGPAQWLAAPKVGLTYGDSLSMESADDTSESEGKWTCPKMHPILQVSLFTGEHDHPTAESNVHETHGRKPSEIRYAFG